MFARAFLLYFCCTSEPQSVKVSNTHFRIIIAGLIGSPDHRMIKKKAKASHVPKHVQSNLPQLIFTGASSRQRDIWQKKV